MIASARVFEVRALVFYKIVWRERWHARLFGNYRDLFGNFGTPSGNFIILFGNYGDLFGIHRILFGNLIHTSIRFTNKSESSLL